MESKLLNIEIVSADHVVYRGLGKMVVATASTGEIGILPGHAPLLALLKPGHVIVKQDDDTEELIYVSGGFLEVQPSTVTILADVAESADEMDEDTIKQAREKAAAALASQTGDIDFKKAQHDLAVASAKLELLQKKKHLSSREKRFADKSH